MRKNCAVPFLLCVLCVSIVSAKEPLMPATAPLEIPIPAFEAQTLFCGMKVLFLRNTELPLVSVDLLVPGGEMEDPEGEEGLSNLMTSAMRNGGAGKLSPEAFDAALENRAASMESGSDKENFSAGFKCLSKDLDDVLGLFADMVRRPQFDAKRLETDRADTLDALNRLEDTPDDLTRVLFNRGLMGSSPYGRWASPKSVAGITREDILRFYEDNFGPQNSVLAVTGNFDEQKTLAQLEALFAGWKSRKRVEVSADAKPQEPIIYFYPKDVTQVFIRYGVLGLKRHDPRDIPLQVGNYVLGGSGFTSRLMQEIRSNRGLAYFVDSVSVPYDIRGVFEVIGGTRPDSVKEYLETMFKVVEDFGKAGPTERELEEAKRSMIEEYAYNFESPFTLSGYKASLDFHGYPEDYLSTYRKMIKAVTREQATEAAGFILNQKDWVMVVCGPADLGQQLAAFGKVVTVTSLFGPAEK